MKKWICIDDLDSYKEAEQSEIENAMRTAVAQVERNLPEFTDQFREPTASDSFINRVLTWTGRPFLDRRDLAFLRKCRHRRRKRKVPESGRDPGSVIYESHHRTDRCRSS